MHGRASSDSLARGIYLRACTCPACTFRVRASGLTWTRIRANLRNQEFAAVESPIARGARAGRERERKQNSCRSRSAVSLRMERLQAKLATQKNALLESTETTGLLSEHVALLRSQLCSNVLPAVFENQSVEIAFRHRTRGRSSFAFEVLITREDDGKPARALLFRHFNKFGRRRLQSPLWSSAML